MSTENVSGTGRGLSLPLDDYEAANLLHALATHPCLNSGDWYLQVRERLRDLVGDIAPNPLYCQRNGGHDA